jgi:hypothetical protein
MRHLLILMILIFLIPISTYGQTIIIPVPTAAIGAAVMPEHGFLPGRKFQFYQTIDKYDFSGLKLRIELFDCRNSLKIKKTECSDIEFTNTSEFSDPDCIFIVSHYLDTLFKQTGAIIDISAKDTLQVRFEGIDARLIGFGYIRAHGLCQMTMKYHNIYKTYCIDITDADKHSPISPNAFVSRLTATRIIASASMREVIEQFFVDLRSLRSECNQ